MSELFYVRTNPLTSFVAGYCCVKTSLKMITNWKLVWFTNPLFENMYQLFEENESSGFKISGRWNICLEEEDQSSGWSRWIIWISHRSSGRRTSRLLCDGLWTLGIAKISFRIVVEWLLNFVWTYLGNQLTSELRELGARAKSSWLNCDT